MKGEVAAGRARRRRTVIAYAKMQLEGGEVDDHGWMVCKKCRSAGPVDAELEPCAFCNRCKDDVLDCSPRP